MYGKGNGGGYGGGRRSKMGGFELLMTVIRHVDPSDPFACFMAIIMLTGAIAGLMYFVWGIQGQTTCWRFNPGAAEDYGSNAGCLIRVVTTIFRPSNFEPSSDRRPYQGEQPTTPVPQPTGGIAVPPTGGQQP
jgi:hypothetical protein